MSKIFYDHLLSFEKLNDYIKVNCLSSEEREELWNLVDELLHYRVLTCILENLSEEYHYDFLEMFYSNPYDERILNFLGERIDKDIKILIQEETNLLLAEIFSEIIQK